MQNVSYDEKGKSRESKVKDKMMKTEAGELSRSAWRGGDQDFKRRSGLPDEWDKTAEMLKKIAETTLGVTFGKQKGNSETW